MMNDAKKTLRTLRRFLKESGHRRSIASGLPIDADGQPIPWFTYPAIAHLDQHDWSRCSVLEWGSGNSTLWWAARARSVVTVDGSPDWYDRVRREAPGNVEALLAEDDPNLYVEAAPRGPFNVVVIDGRHRAACVERAAEVVADEGLVILDNSDRYPELCGQLREGRCQVDFVGFGPINDYPWITSLFLPGSSPAPSREGRPFPHATY